MTIIIFIAGLALLIVGAELLVRGASRLASAFGLSPLVIGLTVVAFGTSSPELAVSVNSAVTGQAGIAMGNVVGSNIFNILFILGLSALIIPLTVAQQLIRLDVPLMIVLSVLVLLLALDGVLVRWEGLMMVVCLFSYIWYLYKRGDKESLEVREEYEKEFSTPAKAMNNKWRNVGFVLGGLVMLALGSTWLVDASVIFAKYLGVSDTIIGLTIVAAGTSLPEVVTSIVAAIKGERDIAVGNVVGSNIFNILGVLGIAAAVTPGGIAVQEAMIRFDIPVMIAVAFAAFPIFFSQGVIRRWEGGLFFAYYILYTSYLILQAMENDLLPSFGAVMLYFVLPLTGVTLVVITLDEIRRQRRIDT